MRHLRLFLATLVSGMLVSACSGAAGTSSISSLSAGATPLGAMRPAVPHPPFTTVQSPAMGSCPTMACIYVTNAANTKRKQNAVRTFLSSANGNVKPQLSIKGSSTGLLPRGVAVDANRNIYVANGTSVTVYAAGASGNAAPIQTINGTYTGLNSGGAGGVGVDSSDNIYVAYNGGGTTAVYVFAAGANGNVHANPGYQRFVHRAECPRGHRRRLLHEHLRCERRRQQRQRQRDRLRRGRERQRHADPDHQRLVHRSK